MFKKIDTTIFLFLALLFSVNIGAQEVKIDSLNLSISKARKYALENNYKMKNSRLDVEAAKKRVWESTAIGLPQISGKIDYNNNLTLGVIPLTITDASGKEQTSYIQMGSPHSATGSLTVSQLIFDGSYIVGLQAASVYKQISELAEFKSETLIDEAVTSAYAGAILNDEIVKILKDNLVALEGNLDQTKAFYESGLTEEQNVDQLQILVSSAKNLLFSAERDRETSYQMLKFTMGMNINSPIKLVNGIEFLLLDNLDENLADLGFDIENNIDFSIAENQVKLQQLLASLEKTKYLPSIKAVYNTKQDAFSDSFNFFSSDNKWYGAQVVGVSMNIPIFNSGTKHAKVQQAKIKVEKAKNSQQETSQKLILDFQKAKNTYLSSINQYYTAKENMELSKNIRKKEATKYFEGMSTSLDLSNAEVQMFNTQKSYVLSIFALIQSKAAIDRYLKVRPKEDE
jgi:outer membrane protein TolC